MDDDWYEGEREWPEGPLESEADWVAGKIDEAADHMSGLIAWGFLDHGADWIRAWHRYDLEWSDGDSRYLTIPRDRLESFVDSARENRGIFDLAMFVSTTRLDHGREIPEPLRRLTAEYLRGECPRPAVKRGRSRNWARDYIIIDGMNLVMNRRMHLPEVRPLCRLDIKGARKNRQVSASEIVLEALKRTEIGHMDLQRIHKIWGSKIAQADYEEARNVHVASCFERLDEPERV